jgi:hypothetical protein
MVETRQEGRAVQLPDHRIDLALERERLAKGLDVDDADRLPGIGRRGVVLVEIDDVGAIGGAVQSAGKEAEHQRQRRPLVAADRQQKAVIGARGVGKRPALPVDHPAFRHRFALLRGDLDLAVGGDRGGHVEHQRRLLERRHGDRDRVGRQQHVNPAPRRQVVGVADCEIDPDHVVGERHRGIDRGGAGMVAMPHPDPADAVVARQVDRGLDRAGDHQAAEAVVAIDQRGGLDAADILRQPKHPVPVGARDVGGGHQLRCPLCRRRRNTDRPVGGGDKAGQRRRRDARRSGSFLGHSPSPLALYLPR